GLVAVGVAAAGSEEVLVAEEVEEVERARVVTVGVAARGAAARLDLGAAQPADLGGDQVEDAGRVHRVVVEAVGQRACAGGDDGAFAGAGGVELADDLRGAGGAVETNGEGIAVVDPRRGRG